MSRSDHKSTRKKTKPKAQTTHNKAKARKECGEKICYQLRLLPRNRASLKCTLRDLNQGRHLDHSGIAAWCADMIENKFLETAVRGSLRQNAWEPRDWSDIIRKKTQGFGAAPPKRPSQKPLSVQKSAFFAFFRARARAMGASRLVGHHTQNAVPTKRVLFPWVLGKLRL